jgi:hypothetical protein
VDYPDKSHVCPHCQRFAAFDLRNGLQLRPEFREAAYSDQISLDLGSNAGQYSTEKSRPYETWLVIFQCQGCAGCSIFIEYRYEIPVRVMGGEPTVKQWFQLVYPNRPPRQLPGEGVPDAVRSFYEEGGVAQAAGAPRAAAAMFRGTVEAMCDALGVPRTAPNKTGKEYPRNLWDRVNDLEAKGVDRDIVDDLHEARLVGNDSVHDGLIYAADELADVADLIADAVRLAFVQPAEKKAMREKRNARREANQAQN